MVTRFGLEHSINVSSMADVHQKLLDFKARVDVVEKERQNCLSMTDLDAASLQANWDSAREELDRLEEAVKNVSLIF